MNDAPFILRCFATPYFPAYDRDKVGKLQQFTEKWPSITYIHMHTVTVEILKMSPNFYMLQENFDRILKVGLEYKSPVAVFRRTMSK